MSSEQAERRKLIVQLTATPLSVAALPLLGLAVAEGVWEWIGIAVATILIAAILAFAPWARYRRRIGRPIPWYPSVW
jgi:hypothetical protein